jgi:hypothetical protein
MVGLLPLCATTVIEPWQRERVPRTVAYFTERRRRKPELMNSVHATGPNQLGVADRGIIALVNQDRLRRILTRMLDENEFLSPYGIRALSSDHGAHPYVIHVEGHEYRVNYLPAESDTGMFGGNSNWRGPIWMPVNALLIRALLQFYLYYGDNFKIECPTGSGNLMNLFEVAREIANRLERIFLRDKSGRRPVYGGTEKFQTDPHWKDYILFYEYFHGDNGAGLGASHQTGWTGLVGKMIELSAAVTQQQRCKPADWRHSRKWQGRSEKPVTFLWFAAEGRSLLVKSAASVNPVRSVRTCDAPEMQTVPVRSGRGAGWTAVCAGSCAARLRHHAGGFKRDHPDMVVLQRRTRL